MPGTLICYGDSNTYGYDPHDTNEGRYPKEVRWTGILDTETDWKVENHGVNGRSIPHTVSTVKFACQQVRDWHRKPNSVWLLVMLGTNDLLENPDFTAADVAKRMERFLKRMMEEAGLASRKMRLRLIAPPAMQEGQWVDRPELLTESRNLGKEYKRIAKRLGIAFTDASGWEIPTIYDGVHFDERRTPYFCRNIRKELIFKNDKEKTINGKGRFDHGLSWTLVRPHFKKVMTRYLMEQGQNIGILEMISGAINVDMMLSS